ncbi:ROK family protein [Streptomyces sp. AC512_CC834]|uniref:ROK family protein n=1 Tax=Streptomyces sp. AC512_CC834 TaxID=2823691 RepID=UPI0027E4B91E|nr:ROK family protein [Streptomyces sp. AC512_CC834]
MRPVLEIGGTHVTAAMVDLPAGAVHGETAREPLPPHGCAEEILGRLARAASRLGAPPSATWGVAVPGPFDYEAGLALFEGVGKFDALYGVDVDAALRARIRPTPATLRFVNDADAFGLGEHTGGAAAGHARAICLTLGSGVGSAFLADGMPVNDGPHVPPQGSAHRLAFDGRPLEDTVSRRAIRAAYARAADGSPDDVPDVRGIAARARTGDALAGEVLEHAFRALGVAMAPWVNRFAATVLVVGGSIATSWDLVVTPLRDGLVAGGASGPSLAPARLPDTASLLGAARWAASRAADGEESQGVRL